MYRIRVFNGFGPSSESKDVYERLCETHLMQNYGANQEIYFTNDDDYTHAFILNLAMPNILPHIPKQNVVGFAFEPIEFLGLTVEFVQYAHKYIGKYFIGDTTKYKLPNPFIEHYSYMWHMTPIARIPDKNNIMSIMVSDKNNASGHKYRHKLVQAILGTNLPIDIYGRGCKFYRNLNDSRVKGIFDEHEPYESYKFHICIENVETAHYFSEKITNTLLSGTTPIYLGCQNIDTYFPKYICHLDGSDVEKDITMLRSICENPDNYQKIIDIDYVKNTIFPLRNLESIFAPLEN
jgi:hypothetical protein